MQLTVLPLVFLLLLTSVLCNVLYIKLKTVRAKLKASLDIVEKLKRNPDGSLEILNDLVNNKGVVLRVTRVDPHDIFLRSPREVE